MNENIIAWNVTNWITVVLMAAVAFLLIGVGMKWYGGKSVSGARASSAASGQPQTIGPLAG